MLGKQFRYPVQKGFPKQIAYSPLFTLRYNKHKGIGLRAAVVVSKKIDARATGRNRIKRLFRSALFNILNEKNIDFDVLIFVKKEAKDKNQNEIKEEILKTLSTIQ